MALLSTSLQGFSTPSGGVSTITAWKQFTVANAAATADPNTLLTSCADSGGEIQFRGSDVGGTAGPDDCYQLRYLVIDPDSGDTVTWSDGNFVGIEIWMTFGSNYPDADNEACYAGVHEDGSATDGNLSGMTVISSSARIASCTWNAIAGSTTTWGSNDVIFGRISLLPDATGSNVTIDGVTTIQFDDATSPARVIDSIRSSGYAAVPGNLRLVVCFSGDCDAIIHYRLLKTPVAPT